MSIFDRPGLYIRTPGGNVEDVQAMRDAGFAWVAINVGDHEDEAWEIQRQRCVNAGMPILPWAYVRSAVDMADLCNLARSRYNSRVIINAERELWEGKITVDEIAAVSVGMDAALSTLPIPHTFIQWTKVKHLRIHCQIFPQENMESQNPRFCRALWYGYGVNQVDFMYGNHDLTPSAFPPLAGAFSIYTADDSKDFGQTYSTWGPHLIAPLDIPYTGPYYHNQFGKAPIKGQTVKALKIAMHNAGFGNFSNPDAQFNQALKNAMIRFQRSVGITPLSGNYGLGTYNALRTLTSAIPGILYALNQEAIDLIWSDR